MIDFGNKSIRIDNMTGTLMAAAAHNGRGKFGVIEFIQDGARCYCYVRMLTPKECFRQMGFADADFKACKDAGISDTQIYKQAGNSIVVNVLMAIFGELYGVAWQKKVYGNWYKTEQNLLQDLPIMNWQAS